MKMRKIVMGILIAGLVLSLGVGLTWAANNSQSPTTNTQTATTIQQETSTDTLNCPDFYGRAMRHMGQKAANFEERAANLEERAANLREKMLSNLKEKLGLTDDQVSQIQAALDSSSETVKNLQDQLKTAQQDLRDALLANPTDNLKLAQAQEKISSLEKQLLDNRVQTALKIKEIVGADKFSEFSPFLLRPQPPKP